MGENNLKFKVGDVVRTKFGKGVVKGIGNYGDVLVYHYDWSNGHNNNGEYEGNHCWFLKKDYITLSENDITITREGNKVIAKYGDRVGVAKCSPEDDFGFETGAKLAFERLFTNDKSFKIGDLVKITDKCGEIWHFFPIGTIGKVIDNPQDDKCHVEVKRWFNNGNDCCQIVPLKDLTKLDEPQVKKEAFKPYLTCDGENYGFIGEETNLTALFGEKLYIGDVVEYYNPKTRETKQRAVVKYEDRVFIMGCGYATCNLENGIDSDGWQYRKVKSYKDLTHNEVIDEVKVILKEGE